MALLRRSRFTSSWQISLNPITENDAGVPLAYILINRLLPVHSGERSSDCAILE